MENRRKQNKYFIKEIERSGYMFDAYNTYVIYERKYFLNFFEYEVPTKYEFIFKNYAQDKLGELNQSL